MKKKIASILFKFANLLDPLDSVLKAPLIKEYDAKQIAIGYEITKKDVKDFGLKHCESSVRNARKHLIEETEACVIKSILATARDLIAVSSYKDGDRIIVEGRLNVYVPQKDQHTK